MRPGFDQAFRCSLFIESRQTALSLTGIESFDRGVGRGALDTIVVKMDVSRAAMS
jgi:hypothetical protein